MTGGGNGEDAIVVSGPAANSLEGTLRKSLDKLTDGDNDFIMEMIDIFLNDAP